MVFAIQVLVKKSIQLSGYPSEQGCFGSVYAYDWLKTKPVGCGRRTSAIVSLAVFVAEIHVQDYQGANQLINLHVLSSGLTRGVNRQ